MREVSHLSHLPDCPFLPFPEVPLTAAAMRRFGDDRGAEFYLGALECGHSLWRQGLPAQAILQLNRAFSADLDGSEPVLRDWPLPYEAAAWIMRNRMEDQFIGNPRRHFQHLATRMVEPRKELRTWRAWACWRLACLTFPDYPADEWQIQEEGIVEPTPEQIAANLERLGLPGEVEIWRRALAE